MVETFTWIPSKGFIRESKPTVSMAQFGDGYSQRIRKGINNLNENWKLTFTNNNLVTSAAILAFFVARDGVESFYWTPPGEATQYKVLCSEWSTEYSSHISRTIQATFTRVYDI